MTLDEIIKERLKRLNDIPDRLMNGVERSQQTMLNEIDTLLNQLDVVDGSIVMSKENIIKIGKITEDLRQVLHGSDYVDAVKTFINEFPKQAKITTSQYNKMGLDIPVDDAKMLEALTYGNQKAALDLLSDNAIDNALLTPIKQQLNASVTSSANFKQTLDTIRTYISGGTINDEPIEGNMYRYVKQVAYDSYATADRSYGQQINNSLGLDWYVYRGGELPTTRCFCDERNGKYYHRKEIELWGQGLQVGSCDYPWQGMRKGTNSETIFTFVGGYNCRHILVPVMEERVPPADIEKAKQKGYIK